MNEYVAILSTLAGVLVGGLANFLSTRNVKHQEWRLALARDQINRREELYSSYLAEAQRLTAQAIYGPLEIPKDVQAMDKMIAQMTLLSPTVLTDAAWELRRHLLRARSAAPEGLDDRPNFEQLSETFVALARRDLEAYRIDA